MSMHCPMTPTWTHSHPFAHVFVLQGPVAVAFVGGFVVVRIVGAIVPVGLPITVIGCTMVAL